MEFKVELKGVKEALRTFDDVEKRELPFAMSKAINDTARLIRKAEVDTMQQIFHKPTRWVLNSLFMRPSTKQRLQALVYFKDQAVGYMLPHVQGGTRPQKRSEKLLKTYWVPGRAARLNAYGNISPGQVVQILSATHKAYDPYSWTTARSRKKNPKPRDYFIVRHQRGRLFPGVWERHGKTKSPRPIIRFIGTPQYKRRFHFYEIAQKVADANLGRLFKEAMSYALSHPKF